MACEEKNADKLKNIVSKPLSNRIVDWARKREISPEAIAEGAEMDGAKNIPKQPNENPPQIIRIVTAHADETIHQNVEMWSKADSPLYVELAGLAEDNDRLAKKFEVKKARLKEAEDEHSKARDIRKGLNSVYSIGWWSYYIPLLFLSAPEAVLSYLTLQGISDNTYVLYALAGFMAIVFAFSGHKLGAYARQPFSWQNATVMSALIVMPLTLVVVAAEIRSKAVLQSGLITKFWHGDPPSFNQFLLLFLTINGLIMLLAFALSYCYRRHIPEIREADRNLKIAKAELKIAQSEFTAVYNLLANKRRLYRTKKARREKLMFIWSEKCNEIRDWAITIAATYAAANNLVRTDGEEIAFDDDFIPTIDIKEYAASIGKAFEDFPELEEFPDEAFEQAA